MQQTRSKPCITETLLCLAAGIFLRIPIPWLPGHHSVRLGATDVLFGVFCPLRRGFFLTWHVNAGVALEPILCAFPLTLDQFCASSCCSPGCNDYHSAEDHQIHFSSPHATVSLLPSHPAAGWPRCTGAHSQRLSRAMSHW